MTIHIQTGGEADGRVQGQAQKIYSLPSASKWSSGVYK